jgi:hypothetical protein
MTKTQFTVTLMWRDEAYGSISSGAQAFRHSQEPLMSDNQFKQLSRVFKRFGFEGNFSRGSYIAQHKDAENPVIFAAALEEAGYIVKHYGNIPASLAQVLTSTQADELTDEPAAPKF